MVENEKLETENGNSIPTVFNKTCTELCRERFEFRKVGVYKERRSSLQKEGTRRYYISYQQVSNRDPSLTVNLRTNTTVDTLILSESKVNTF